MGVQTAQPFSSLEAGMRTPSSVDVDVRADGVAVISLGAAVASRGGGMIPALCIDLGRALDAVCANPNVAAVVLRSETSEPLVAGATVEFVRSIRFAQDAEDMARDVAERFDRLGRLHGPALFHRSSASRPPPSAKNTVDKPVVALVSGPVLGAWLELSLACTAAIATSDPKTTLGFPEITLGLVPAANGLLRVAERAGLGVALDLGISGRSVTPAEALRLGLVDEVVPPAIAFSVALALALRLASDPAHKHSLARARGRGTRLERIERALLEKNPVGRAALFRKVRAETHRRFRAHYPAVDGVIELLARFGSRGFRAAAELEARTFGDLVASEEAHRLVDLHKARGSLDRDSGLEAGETASAFPVERVAVLGAGLMGAGIAVASVDAGYIVRLKDADDASIGRALRYVRGALDERVRRGERSPLERDSLFGRVTGTIDYTGFRNADVVVEAVYEDIELKHAVLRDVERLVRDTCVIASNTTSIPISRIAEASQRPEMIVGMHYFSPVYETALLEVVRTKVTDPRAVATAVAIGKRQKKTVIVVRDGAAFYTTRILVPYLDEAMRLLMEGAPVDDIDTAMLDWGFPVGPFQLMDEVGIDVHVHVGRLTRAAFADRMRAPEALASLRADDRKGKKNARGFYLYGRAAPRSVFSGRLSLDRTVDPTVYAALGVTPRPGAHSAEEITLRCAIAMVNEALRSYGDDVLRSARDGDVGAVLGVGFPRFRGGPFRYVDVLGTSEVLRRTRSLEQRFGARFEPAPLLIEMARNGRRFYG